jgi:hypothetical protein
VNLSQLPLLSPAKTYFQEKLCSLGLLLGERGLPRGWGCGWLLMDGGPRHSMPKNQPAGGRVRTNYVLIDYESVQPEALAVLTPI